MTKEQGEALIKYVDAAIAAALAAHTVGRHDDSMSWRTSTEAKALATLADLVALLP